MNENFKKLVDKLIELFMLNQPDLDFGIYRIMNSRRREITKFLEEDLLPQVRDALNQYESGSNANLSGELKKAVDNAKELGVDPDSSPKVKELKAKITEAGSDISQVENEVYSHLYNFFSRYYSGGDFLSLRRYKEGVYAIPYEGEEVKLYWANHDQYYIKTSEYLRDYKFNLPNDKKAHFKLTEADIEKDNRKESAEKERRFVLAESDFWSVEDGEVVLKFHYLPLGNGSNQKDLNSRAIEAILAADIPAEFKQQLEIKDPTEKNKDRTLLEKHLTDYTSRYSFDYFIHKDLGGFLSRELDFYIKNEVMHLDDIEEETAPKVEQYLAKIRAIRRVAAKIITFLAQLEEFQKKLWLKKKFVTETNYCITLDRIPESLYEEIVANDAQRAEWVKLFAIDEIKAEKFGQVAYSKPLTVEFLKANPFLVLDTILFDEGFKEKLIASIDNIDEQTDGTLIHSENFQALNLLQQKYKKQVDCVHIDPPYNTATSGFLYKNEYQHSSWLSMMENRLSTSFGMLSDKASYMCHIDENEYENLHQLFDNFKMLNAGTLVWDKRNPMNGGHGLATQHEYVVWRTNKYGPIYMRNKTILSMLLKVAQLIKKEGRVSNNVRKQYSTWINANNGLSGGEKAYRYIDDEGRIYQSVSLRAPEPRQDKKFHLPLIHPVTNKPCSVPPNGFSRTPETLKEMMERGEILFGKDETTQPRQKVYLTEDTRRQVSSLIQDAKKGKADTAPLGINFPYCHPTSLYEELISAVTHAGNEHVLDYFAGSGTTGHAVINLNREDNGNRKYILVEMGSYFDEVTKPRIQKVIYSSNWKAGKPVEREGVSHCLKYIRLESYEDTLNNLVLELDKDKQMLLESNKKFKESYMLGYMLDVESKGSLLNIDSFKNPFDYKLNIATGSVGDTQPVKIDLVETFNYLIGLKVKTSETIRGFKVITGESLAGDKILVIWRNIEEKDNDTLDEFCQKMKYNPLDMEFDIIYVNGDNNLENLKRDEDTWKVRMIEEEFTRLMFEN